MKKLALLIIALAIGVSWYVWQGSHPGNRETVEIQPTVSKPDASDATFVIEGEPVTLKNGEANETELINMMAYGDVNGDKKNDTAVILVRSGSGSGVFVYVGAYLSGPVRYKGSNTVFAGDRISPTSIAVKNGEIVLNYLDRGPDEPMAAEPTLPKTKTYTYRNSELEEK